jgi:uncharacterized membrane protein (DUF2068 family)
VQVFGLGVAGSFLRVLSRGGRGLAGIRACEDLHVDVLLPPGTQRPRRRLQVDWELVACGVRGHAIVGVDAQEAGDDPVLVRDQGDVRWHRCLRCDCWTAVPRPRSPTRRFPPGRSEIEVPLRGRALRDKIVLRLIAVERVLHFVVLGLLGLALLLFAANRNSLHAAFYRILTAVQGGVGGGPVQASGHVGIVRDLDRLFTLSSGRLREVGVALLVYGALEGLEAVGLWFLQRWAEYLTLVSTTILLPLEIYEIVHKASVLKVIGFLINLAVVVYLLVHKRLFGLRGGGAADQALREQDMGWDAIERATLATGALSAEKGGQLMVTGS